MVAVCGVPLGCSKETSSQAPQPPTTLSAAASRCGDPDAFSADVDGDERPDRVYHLYLQDSSRGVLGVCTAAGIHSEIPAGEPQANDVVDIDLDGRDEVLFGGTTSTRSIEHVAVLDGTALAEVTLANSEPLVVVRGQLEGAERFTRKEYGCRDADGDGRRDLILSTFIWQGSTATWHAIGYRITGHMAAELSNSNGTAEGLARDAPSLPIDIAGGSCAPAAP
jgi:hypothetical protein